ncbi:MAG TPA: hypothetical protein VGU20_10830 [Stellaceae bacterium]|nr:hypothetical protein [Stellaceae bacterium]
MSNLSIDSNQLVAAFIMGLVLLLLSALVHSAAAASGRQRQLPQFGVQIWSETCPRH